MFRQEGNNSERQYIQRSLRNKDGKMIEAIPAGYHDEVKLHHLRDFLAVAEQGSLRAAARQLKMAQPAITRSIQELEKELGVPLFARHARGAIPTPMGEAFARRARSVANELVRAREEIDQLRGMTQGKLRIALSLVPHLALLPDVLRPFRSRYPGVHLDVIDAVFPTVGAEVLEGTIDFYIGPPPESLPDGLLDEKLFDNTRVIVGRKGHPLGASTTLRQLVDAEWITTSITARPEHELGPLFEAYSLPPPKLVLQSHSALTLMVAVISSDLLTMLPVQWTEFSLTRNALQAIRVEEPLPAPPICILRRAALPLTPAAEHFCDLVRRAAGHLSGRASKKA